MKPCVIAFIILSGSDARSAPQDGAPDFGHDVQPILDKHCIRCHGPDEHKGGLRLHDPEDVRRGGISDDFIVPGHSDRSYLVRRLLGLGDEDRMPPNERLPDADLATIRRWIDAGAAWPRASDDAFEPAPAGVRRLTDRQYRNAIHDVLGVDVEGALHPNEGGEGFSTALAYKVSAAAWSVELYRDTALAVARLAFRERARRRALLGCEPASADDVCVRRYLARVGRALFRRPLRPFELRRHERLAGTVAARLHSVAAGVEAATAALLQSPHFLYVPETGTPAPDHPGWLALDGATLATRMALFLWTSLPDDALLFAAERGRLATAAGVRTESERMLTSPRARAGVDAFFEELLQLEELDRLAKDPALYPVNTPPLRWAMRQEVRRLVERVVFDERQDVLTLFDTSHTFVDAGLARLYGIEGAFPEDTLVPAVWPDDRRGLLGTAAFLATNALATRSSPTLRGVFVRERLLCQDIPPPPDAVGSELRAPAGAAPGPRTMRERLAQHATDKACAGCHRFFDPIGLTLERYDGLGARRTLDEGLVIDARGELDGTPVDGLAELARALRNHRRTAPCLTEQLVTYALGHTPGKRERRWVEALAAEFSRDGHDLQRLLVDIVASDAFRYVTAPAIVARSTR